MPRIQRLKRKNNRIITLGSATLHPGLSHVVLSGLGKENRKVTFLTAICINPFSSVDKIPGFILENFW